MDVDLSQNIFASTPYSLNNLKKARQATALSTHSLLADAVNTLLVDSGFVRLDSPTGAPVYGFQVPDGHSLRVSKLSLRYTHRKLIESKHVAIESKHVAPDYVAVTLRKVRHTLVIHGCLSWNKNTCYSVKLYEPRLHKDVFYKKFKDKLVLPLLFDISDKAGLLPPSCFMLLPTELKLKVLELVSGADLANLGCVCSELRHLTSNNSLWKMKCVEEFRNHPLWKRHFKNVVEMFKNSGRSDSIYWKHVFFLCRLGTLGILGCFHWWRQ